jgi:hypothetical protein
MVAAKNYHQSVSEIYEDRDRRDACLTRLITLTATIGFDTPHGIF